MGIFMDTLEDHSERIDQLQFRLFSQQAGKPKSKPVFECFLCSYRSTSYNALEAHIQESHSSQHVYIRANGRVARELHHFSEPLDTLECVNIGYKNLDAEVATSENRRKIPINGTVDLKDIIPSGFTGEVQISLFVNSRLRGTYFLFFVEQPRLDSRQLDKHVFDLQIALERGETPDWHRFEMMRDQPGRTLFERDYLNGFYEYSLAFHCDKTGKVGSGKFEKAMTLLGKFNTDFARTARFILAIRINSFQALKDCPEESLFYPSRAFFHDHLLTLPKKVRRQSTSERGIYVDGFTERILHVVRAFYAREFKYTEDVTMVLGGRNVTNDPNNEHKCHLILARTYRVKDDRVMAMRYYDQLSNHPQFRTEAQEYCS